MRLVEETDQI
ncbi:hypothetical protein Patl1_02892 [Pistacia atlantica]|uniref:Uncharacterized protein n=1 Tax=Pistacia atlantica TaxID=434234 RepID=A0ACC1C713_9ROSI|nr:hypothetical protein Patl1_02892 [Pistacia atlantica]